MLETINAFKDELMNLLNTKAFSTDSIEGWIIILLLGFIAWNIYRKALNFVGWSVSVILLFQVFYYLGQTGFNNIIPLATVFKYDVLTSLAQCFAGTRVCDGILWINAAIHTICVSLWTTVCEYWNSFVHWYKNTNA